MEPRLTPRELQVACLVAEGYTNPEIAKLTKLTEHTIKNYLFRIFDKVGCENRVTLTRWCLKTMGFHAVERISGLS